MLKEYRIYRIWTYISLSLIALLIVFVPNSKQRFVDQTIYDFTRNTDDKLYIFSNLILTCIYLRRMFLDNKFIGVDLVNLETNVNSIMSQSILVKHTLILI